MQPSANVCEDPLASANSTVYQLFAASEFELEQTDIVMVNLAVAREVPSLPSLNVRRYVDIIDQWTQQFVDALPGMERKFHATPTNWTNDIRFFRTGMLQGFLGHVAGILVSHALPI